MSDNKQLQEAVSRMLATSRKNEIAKQLDEMRRELAVPQEERRVMRFACAVTGRKFAVVYKRASPAERFRIAAIETGPVPAQSVGPRSGAASSLQAHGPGDFDHTGWRCPYCSADWWVVQCRCGDNVCRGRTVRLAGGREYFRCHDACGEAAYLVDAKQVWAEAQAPARAARSINPPVAGPALPKPGERR